MTDEPHDPAATDTAAADSPSSATTGSLILSVLLYTVARLALVVVLGLAIYFGGQLAGVTVPPLVAAVFAVLIALPLGMVLFKTLRVRVNEQIAQVDERRSAQRDDLHARLSGRDA